LLRFNPYRFASAQLTSSPPFPLLGAASPPADIATSLHRVTLPSHGAETSLLPLLHLPTMLHHIASPRAETKAVNSHHRHRPSSLYRLTPTLYYYKKVISTVSTLSTTQPCLYFVSSLTRAPCHWSSTYHHHSLSLPSHVHHPSTQRHPW
jgi:hypothetical protein